VTVVHGSAVPSMRIRHRAAKRLQRRRRQAHSAAGRRCSSDHSLVANVTPIGQLNRSNATALASTCSPCLPICGAAVVLGGSRGSRPGSGSPSPRTAEQELQRRDRHAGRSYLRSSEFSPVPHGPGEPQGLIFPGDFVRSCLDRTGLGTILVENKV
jgi:hypothetical protein